MDVLAQWPTWVRAGTSSCSQISEPPTVFPTMAALSEQLESIPGFGLVSAAYEEFAPEYIKTKGMC